jgi:hypothetical protein
MLYLHISLLDWFWRVLADFFGQRNDLAQAPAGSTAHFSLLNLFLFLFKVYAVLGIWFAIICAWVSFQPKPRRPQPRPAADAPEPTANVISFPLPK